MIVSPQMMKMTVLPSTHKMIDLDSIFPRVVILDIATHGHKKNMGFYSVLYAYLVLAKSSLHPVALRVVLISKLSVKKLEIDCSYKDQCLCWAVSLSLL
jgi:hypothetical protein